MLGEGRREGPRRPYDRFSTCRYKRCQYASHSRQKARSEPHRGRDVLDHQGWHDAVGANSLEVDSPPASHPKGDFRIGVQSIHHSLPHNAKSA